MPAPAVVSTIGADDEEETRLDSLDAPNAAPARPAISANGYATGSVRLPDSLPRSRGVLGDIAYLFRVIARRRAARVELAKNEQRIANEKEARNHKLLEMARHAIGDERIDLKLVDEARAELLAIEEKRSLHAGRVAAADEKVAVLERHRSEEQIRGRAERERLRLEIEAIETSLQPLVKRTTEARKQTARLHRQLRSLDDKMRLRQASLVSVDGPANAAAVQAEVASLQAERDAVAADEPAMAAEVDDLEPKIASLKSTRSELRRKLEIVDREESLDEVRVAEKVAAVKASRIVEDRAVSDQSLRRQDKLLELGEALHNSPPDALNPRLKAVVKHDLEIGTLERRGLELGELMATIETAPMIRGALYLLLGLGALAAACVFALNR